MFKRKRKHYDANFQVRVVCTLQDGKTLTKLASEFDLHPIQIRNWKTDLLEKASEVFSGNKAEMDFRKDSFPFSSGNGIQK